MKRRQRITAVLSMLTVLCAGMAIVLLRRIDQVRAGSTLEEVLYIPSPVALKRMSLGYTGLMADIYWTRAVQYFGGKHHEQSRRYQLLAPLLDITTTLDPQLIAAYQFGSVFLAQKPPEGAGQPDKAVELVERGVRENPNEWRLYYELGFLQYMERHDTLAAARAFEQGSKVPNAHPFLKVLAAAMAQHGGDTATARMLWTATYETTEDNMIRANAIKHLRALTVDDDISHLDELVRRYRERTGQPPANFLALVSAGDLRGIPVDPLGHPYKLMPDGRIEVQSPDDLPFIHRGLPPGREASFFGMPQAK